MDKNILNINSEKEKARIIKFLKETFEKQNIQNAVIGLSGGIDSTLAFYLLSEVLNPKHIFISHLYYLRSSLSIFEPILKAKGITEENKLILSIKPIVDKIAEILRIELNDQNKIRIGNIASRIRMIILFDLAKKNRALVCGTENRSENLLGYFTRFGDQASDIEPIAHLLKTQVYELAGFIGIPKSLINQTPTAGLWEGQTDEGEFGFTYEEADQVLHFYFDKNFSVEKIEKAGFKNAKLIINRSKKNEFKHKTPYHL